MGLHWHRTENERAWHPGEPLPRDHGALSPTLLDLIRKEASPERRVIEVGCGTGRLTFVLAPLFQKIIALDWSEGALDRARETAARQGIGNVAFHLADAEHVDYRQLAKESPQIVVANLCMSDAIITQAARLGAGTFLIFAAFHTDQWRETGAISRFAYSETRLEEILERTGFHPLYLGVERQILRLPSAKAAVNYLEQTGLKAKWQGTERWQGFLQYLERGGDRLMVRAQVIVKARRK